MNNTKMYACKVFVKFMPDNGFVFTFVQKRILAVNAEKSCC
jgi:hypothetical protein